MKRMKINDQGFGHIVVAVLIMTGLAVIGTSAIVFGRAESIVYKNGRIGVGSTTLKSDGTQKVLTYLRNVTFQSLSPDGKLLAYQPAMEARSDTTQYKIAITKVGERDEGKAKVVNVPKGRLYYEISWSPDGQSVMMRFTQKKANTKSGLRGVYIVKADGTGGHFGPYMNNDANGLEGNAINWMPDSSSLFFSRDRTAANGAKVSDLCTVKLDNTERQCTPMETGRLISDFDGTKVSPDGTRILFKSLGGVATDDPRPVDLYIVNLDGTNQKALVVNPSYETVTEAIFSPDGRLILFGYDQRSGFNFYTMNLSGLNRVALTALTAAVGSGRISGWEGLDPDNLPVYKASCSIELPTSPKINTSFTLGAKIANNGNYDLHRPVFTNVALTQSNGKATVYTTYQELAAIKPATTGGATYAVTVTTPGSFTVNVQALIEQYRGVNNVTCSKTGTAVQ